MVHLRIFRHPEIQHSHASSIRVEKIIPDFVLALSANENFSHRKSFWC
jgi:hypothetical protein